jgi:hypothetical protein
MDWLNSYVFYFESSLAQHTAQGDLQEKIDP